MPRYASYANGYRLQYQHHQSRGAGLAQRRSIERDSNRSKLSKKNITNSKIVTWDIGGDDLANAHDHYTQGTCGGTDNEDCLHTAVTTFEQTGVPSLPSC